VSSNCAKMGTSVSPCLGPLGSAAHRACCASQKGPASSAADCLLAVYQCTVCNQSRHRPGTSTVHIPIHVHMHTHIDVHGLVDRIILVSI
jgi:hypothetical protein